MVNSYRSPGAKYGGRERQHEAARGGMWTPEKTSATSSRWTCCAIRTSPPARLPRPCRAARPRGAASPGPRARGQLPDRLDGAGLDGAAAPFHVERLPSKPVMMASASRSRPSESLRDTFERPRECTRRCWTARRNERTRAAACRSSGRRCGRTRAEQRRSRPASRAPASANSRSSGGRPEACQPAHLIATSLPEGLPDREPIWRVLRSRLPAAGSA